jgi:hypothetical protein
MRDKQGLVSPHVHFAEFDCREGPPCPDYMFDPCAAIARAHIEKRRAAGGDRPIIFTSAHRWDWYNAKIGGASLSFHVYENRREDPAIDHNQVGHAPSTLQAWYDSHTNPGGMGYYDGFTHIDPRPGHVRWTGIG